MDEATRQLEETDEEENTTREVIKDIWIKEGNDWSSDEIWNEAAPRKTTEKFSMAYRKRKLELLGHVVRAENDDPMRQVTLKKGSIRNSAAGTRRVGKPKLEWVHENRKIAWKQHRIETDQSHRRKPDKRRKYTATISQDISIRGWAMDKKF